MKRAVLILLLLIVAGIGFVFVSLLPAQLDVSEFAAEAFAEPDSASPPAGMSLSVIKAGLIHSKDVFAYRGGDFGRERNFGADVALIQHPRGNLLIDAGYSREVDQQIASMPPLMKMLTQYSKETPVVDAFAQQGFKLSSIRGLILTHAHWDHVSGLADMRGVPVWLTQQERDFIASDNENSQLARSIGALNYQIFDFLDGAYENYPRSYDVYQDGAVVLVPMFGHTSGSSGVFVNLPSGKRYFFIGDLVWASEAIAIPAERPWLARGMVDAEPAVVRREIVRVHRLAQKRPELVIVPAHDRAVFERIAEFPNSES